MQTVGACCQCYSFLAGTVVDQVNSFVAGTVVDQVNCAVSVTPLLLVQ